VTKIADIRGKSGDELDAMVLDMRKEQFNLRFQKATGQQEGTARIRVLRRDIARAKTIMAERKRASAAQA
jgi:large subunit ribosomal protein L29